MVMATYSKGNLSQEILTINLSCDVKNKCQFITY